MNNEAFFLGVEDSLVKSSIFGTLGNIAKNYVKENVVQPFKENVVVPFGQGYLDDAAQRAAEGNVLQRMTAPTLGQLAVDPDNLSKPKILPRGQRPATVNNPPTGFQGMMYNMGATPAGKKFIGGLAQSSKARERISNASGGAATVNQAGDININAGAAVGQKMKSWWAEHGSTAKTLGLGAAAIGLGAMAMRKRKPQVAAPGGQGAAPFNTPVTPGRRGNHFMKYEG
jgi:hypothetical protein